MSDFDFRCYWCNEAWVAHDKKAVVIGSVKVKMRPNCDCYREHTDGVLLVTETHSGTVLPVNGLRTEHAPARTAQEQRALDDVAIQRLMKAAADAQYAIDMAVAERTAEKFAAMEQAIEELKAAALR